MRHRALRPPSPTPARPAGLGPGYVAAARLGAVAALLALIVGAVGGGPAAESEPEQTRTPWRLRLGVGLTGAARAAAPSANQLAWSETAGTDEDEGEDLAFAPLDPERDPAETLRSRPFVLGDGSCAAFCSDEVRDRPLSEADARAALRRFLAARGVDRADARATVARFDDPATAAIIPAPNLRAALLLLAGWRPYEATVAAVLDGANPTGAPFGGVLFADLGTEAAVATLAEDADGAPLILVNETFRGEPPAQLANVLVHEALHDLGANSHEEEVIANLLDGVAYAEIVQVEPEAARAGTALALANNGALLGLLNSSGRAGPARLGVAGSTLGDVYLGPDLEDIDAPSIRAAIAADRFYGALPRGGSPGGATLSALLARFPHADDLGPDPAFDEATLTAIDRGVGAIISPPEAVDLALTLGLDIATEVTEDVSAGPLSAAAGSLVGRPFVPEPAALDLFRSAAAEDPPRPLDATAGRDALERSLRLARVPPDRLADLLTRYGDRSLRARIPAPALRAAALLLGAREPWDGTLALIRGDLGRGDPLAVRFADLPFGTPVARLAPTSGEPGALLVADHLAGESPAVLASYLVEGAVLHDRAADGDLGQDQAVVAALLGTLAWADAVAADPAAARAGTAAVIARNADLLALLNSASLGTDPDDPLANAATLGILAAPRGVDDILPGLYADADSFAGHALAGRADGSARRPLLRAGPTVEHALAFAGHPRDTSDGRPTFGAAAATLDARLGAFLSAGDVLRLARALGLGAAA